MGLVVRPWSMNVPCHTHNCGRQIEWRIVPEELADESQAIVAGLCDECLSTLYESILGILYPHKSETLTVYPSPDDSEPESSGLTVATRTRRSGGASARG